MNLMQDQNPGGHKEDRASFPNQIQYKVSKIHSPNPTLENGKGGREEGRGGARERGEACVLSRQRERATKREWVRGYLCPLTLELKDKTTPRLN